LLLDAEYIERGILINGSEFPLIRMERARGKSLADVIPRLCASRDVASLQLIARRLREAQQVLNGLGIAHGDISQDNVFVERNSGDWRIRLVDYDSFWAPEIGAKTCSVGIGPLQHPQRPNPIGPHADCAAFRLIDTVLSFLSIHPERGRSPAAFDGGFLLSVREVVDRSGHHADALSRVVHAEFEALHAYLTGPFGPWPVVTSIRSLARSLEMPVVQVMRLIAERFDFTNLNADSFLPNFQADQLIIDLEDTPSSLDDRGAQPARLPTSLDEEDEDGEHEGGFRSQEAMLDDIEGEEAGNDHDDDPSDSKSDAAPTMQSSDDSEEAAAHTRADSLEESEDIYILEDKYGAVRDARRAARRQAEIDRLEAFHVSDRQCGLCDLLIDGYTTCRSRRNDCPVTW
jgi:hypothetical protein